jgi:hypothetical protein
VIVSLPNGWASWTWTLVGRTVVANSSRRFVVSLPVLQDDVVVVTSVLDCWWLVEFGLAWLVDVASSGVR